MHNVRLDQKGQNGVHIEIVEPGDVVGLLPLQHIELLLALQKIGVGQNLLHPPLVVEIGVSHRHRILRCVGIQLLRHIFGFQVPQTGVEIEILTDETVSALRRATVEISVQPLLVEPFLEQLHKPPVLLRQQLNNRPLHVGIGELRTAETDCQIGQTGHYVNVVVHLAEEYFFRRRTQVRTYESDKFVVGELQQIAAAFRRYFEAGVQFLRVTDLNSSIQLTADLAF